MEKWDFIYRQNAPKMLGVCRRYIRDVQIAEDIVHDAFIKAIEKSDSYSDYGSFEGWLRKIVINTALEYLRKNKRINFSQAEVLDNFPNEELNSRNTHPSKRNIIESLNFTQDELLKIIDELPSHHATVFNLYVLDDYTHKEIGKILNISTGTSKSHLARARKKIQKMLFNKKQKKEESNEKKGFFWFLFMDRTEAIDGKFKNSFEDFIVQPQNLKALKGGDKLYNTQQKPSILKSIASFKFMLIVIVTVIIISIAYFVFTKDYPKHPNVTKTQQQIKIVPKEQKIHLPNDSSIFLPVEIKTKSIPAEDLDTKTVTRPIEKKPVVIHKKIIRRDTIIKTVTVQDEK